MAHLIKTEAIVLSKLNYGDTSKIAHLYTEELGKLPVIIKGGRASKSKMGMIVDPLNAIQVVLHTKETREIQLLTQADLILSPANIKEDLERIKYASSAAELIYALIPEHEPNQRLYNGLKRIIGHFNDPSLNPKVMFLRYFLFFIKEIGYELLFSECNDCGRELKGEEAVYFSLQKGILCSGCRENHILFSDFSQELLENLICLSSKKSEFQADMKTLDKVIVFLEKYLTVHIPEFKGIKSLHIY